MREILIDEASFSQPEEVHAYLARELQFPSYYGANLDALNDCLGDVSEALRCTVYMADASDASSAAVHVADAPDVVVAEDASTASAYAADASSVPTSGSGALASWFPKLVRSLLRAARENENLEVLVHASNFGAFARLVACPGVQELLESDKFITQGIIACVHEEESLSGDK